ncbi:MULTISPECIES: hypothetical protein [Aerosakkonema]|uniref:hypothetical protein n=1 Tax=Aerosakkonema TaxID=1246629 RepID=UPI0035BC7302
MKNIEQLYHQITKDGGIEPPSLVAIPLQTASALAWGLSRCRRDFVTFLATERSIG